MFHKYAPAFLLAAAAFLMLPLTSSRAASDPRFDDATLTKIERGFYLVTLSGCNDCHTPFHMTENGPAPDMSRMLSGHPQEFLLPPAPALPEGPWIGSYAATNTAWSGPWGVSFTSNLTPDMDTGIGSWTEEEFIATLRSGRHRGMGRQILPPMPWPNLAHASDEDLSAIFAYLQQVPAINNRVPDPAPPTVPAP